MTAPESHAEDLVERFRKGDPEAFRVLCEAQTRLLRARIGRRLPTILRRRVSVSDVLQEALTVAFERRGDFEGDGTDAFRNWLLGIADMKARRAIQHHAATARRAADREVSRDRRPDTGEFMSDRASPSQFAIGEEVREVAKEALAALPSDYQEVLRLVTNDGLSVQDVARSMGRSEEAVYKLHARALYQFTEVFKRRKGGDSHG